MATTSAAKASELTAENMETILNVIADPAIPASRKIAAISLDGALDWVERLEEMNAGLAARPRVTFEISDNSSSAYSGTAEAVARFAGTSNAFRVDWVAENGIWKLDNADLGVIMNYANPEVRTPIPPR